MEKLSNALQGLSLELSQAALASQTEKNALLARIQTLAKENQRHLELESMLMGRIKLLEHALWTLRKKHGEESGPEESLGKSEELVSAREQQARRRQASRKGALLRLLQENGLEPISPVEAEAAAKLDRSRKPPRQQQPQPQPQPQPQVMQPPSSSTQEAIAAPLHRSQEHEPPSAVSGLEALDSLTEMARMLEPETLSVPVATDSAPGPEDDENGMREMEERLGLGPDASRMMRRLQKSSMGGKGGKKRTPGGAGVGQLVAAALGSSSPVVARSADSSSSSSSASSSSSSAGPAASKKWAASQTMRSHLDVVRSLAFHDTKPIVVSAADDWTLRLFRTDGTKKKPVNDAYWSLRGHSGPVLSICIGGDVLYSAGVDGSIFRWRIPDPDETKQEGDLTAYLMDSHPEAHVDAIWGLEAHQGKILSFGADRSVKLWTDQDGKLNDLQTVDTDLSCVGARFFADARHAIVGYASAETVAVQVDLESGATLTTLSGSGVGSTTCIAAAVGEASFLTGHDDGNVCCWDVRSGSGAVATFVAHPALVSSVDMTGAFIVSGSSDTVRLWDLRSRACLSDFVAHRKKFDEGVTCLKFHSSKDQFASGGGDGVVKIFSH